MTKSRHHRNTLKRMEHVCAIVQEHYEPGVQAKSYYRVWRDYVYPVYPCCYHTMLRYISTNVKAELREKESEQLKLFEE